MTTQNFEQTLAKNIAALEKQSQTLADLLSKQSAEQLWTRLIPAKGEGYTCEVESGGVVRRVNSAYDPYGEAGKQAGKTLEARLMNDVSTLHCFGLGLGYHLKMFFDTLGDLGRSNVYETDPAWLILSLSIHDFSAGIESGRLNLYLKDIREPPEQIGKDPNDLRWTHPILFEPDSVYYDSLLNRFGPSASGAKPRALIVILYPYSAYLNLSRSVEIELRDLGFETHTCGDTWDELRRSLFDHRPGLIFSMSFSSAAAAMAKQTGAPYLMWDLDKVMNEDYITPDLATNVFAFVTYEEDAIRYIEAGAKAMYLPPSPGILLGHDFDLTDDEREKYSCDISFIGSPLVAVNNTYKSFVENLTAHMETEGGETKETGQKLLAALESVIKRQEACSVYNKNNVREFLEDNLARLEWEGDIPFSTKRLYNIVSKQCCGYQRLYYLKNLAPLKVDVYGAPDWDEVNEDHLVYRGKAGFEYETGKIYRASKINIDITRIYALDGFSGRVMNVLWSGGFLLMNKTSVIDRSFEPGRELAVFETAEEMKEACEYYLSHEQERADIAERGRARVLKDHTVRARVEMMLKVAGVFDVAKNRSK